MALINSASLSITLSVFRQSGAEIRYDWTRLLSFRTGVAPLRHPLKTPP